MLKQTTFSMTLLKSLLIISAVGCGITASWLFLLYSTYGQHTLLFLLKAPSAIMWSYTKNMFVTTPITTTETSTKVSSGEMGNQTITLPVIPPKYTLLEMSHMYQKLNNCGPSSAAMAASSLGIVFDQFFAADQLKGGPNDKNVSPDELVSFLQAQNLQAKYRIQGTTSEIEQLVAQNVPVIVEQWLVKRGSGELVGHYRVVRGYDQQKQLFITNDSFNGANFAIPYSQFDEWWRPFNRTYVVVYKPDQESKVEAILGENWEQEKNLLRAKEIVENEVSTYQDGYAYFNLGSTATALGEYEEAEQAYDTALTYQFPEHFLWYQFGQFETYYQQGNYDKVLAMADELIRHAGNSEEAYYYRGLAFLKKGETQTAKEEFTLALSANPRYQPAQNMLTALSP